MCGIAGYFSTQGEHEAQAHAILRRMQSAIAHRGPDGQGIWMSPQRDAGLAHVRLAILDLSPGGAQPMTSADGRFVISFNGEIYNFAALRDQLRAQGCTFRSESDTEVLLALLQSEGPRGLAKLRGMFALAMWDVQQGRGLLARDGFGIKPLYYGTTANGVVFASELRALLAAGLSRAELNPQAVAGYFATGSVPEPDTLIKGVHLLAPGHFMQWHAGRAEFGCFWEVRFPPPDTAAPEAAIALTRSALEASVAAHLVSDVPVGLFLSGGIDSSALLALAHHGGRGRALDAFSIAVDDPSFDESSVAAATAKQFGSPHHVLRLDAATARDSFDRFLASMDVPSIDGFNTWTVARLASSHGFKVVLSGLGGDEMFGGYPSFGRVPALHRATAAIGKLPGIGPLGARMIRRARGSRWQRAAELIGPGNQLSDAYRAYRGVFPLGDAHRLAAHFTGATLQGTWQPAQDQAPAIDTHDRISQLELTRYMRNQLLRDSDVMSMAHGLELRLPLVDQHLFDTISRIPAAIRLRQGKQLLLDAVPEVPQQVREARKRGFSFPVRAWLQKELGPEFDAATRQLPVATPEWYQQWSVLTFTRWLATRGLASGDA